MDKALALLAKKRKAALTESTGGSGVRDEYRPKKPIVKVQAESDLAPDLKRKKNDRASSHRHH